MKWSIPQWGASGSTVPALPATSLFCGTTSPKSTGRGCAASTNWPTRPASWTEVPELRFIDVVAGRCERRGSARQRGRRRGAARGAARIGRLAAARAPARARRRLSPSTRLTDREALELLRSRDLLEVGARAHEVRERLVPGSLATFIVDRNINYTNVCVSGCRFCAFHCAPGAPEAYVLPREVIHEKIQETLDLGGTAVMMQGGLHPDLDITYFEELFRSHQRAFRHHHPLALRSGDRPHRRGQPPFGARSLCAA